MRLLLMLVLLRPAICAIMGNHPICPGHPSVSILDPSAEKNDPVCDLCEYLKSKNEYYSMYMKCEIFHSSVMLDKLVRDCKRITMTGNKDQLQFFSDVLSLICTSTINPDVNVVNFDGPICECDPCSEMKKLSKPFMKVCAPKMTPDMVSERLRTCRKVKQDQEQLWFFYQDLKAECSALTGENITFSFCDCDVCWLLFYETSDFMTKCGQHMDQAVLNKLFSSCEKIMCDPVELICFKNDLEVICEKKFKLSFDFPQCACEECWLLFQKDSDFMQKCGFELSNDMLKKLMKDCYANLDNLENFMTFIDNLQVTCQNKGKDNFKHEWCYCLDCLLFEDHETKIWKDCIRYMLESVRLTKRKECFNATLEKTLDQYKMNLFEYCNVNYGCNVTFPKCIGCTRTDLSIIFALDYSPSIRNHGYINAVNQAAHILDNKSIGENKTHYGLIWFDYWPSLMFSLVPGYDTYWSRYYLYKHKQYYSYGPGTEIYRLLKMIGDIFRNIHDNRAKYALIITDGYISGYKKKTLQETSDAIPDDVTMLVVGIGYTDVHNLLTIAKNKPQNIYNYNPTPHLNDIYQIKGELMRNIGC